MRIHSIPLPASKHLYDLLLLLLLLRASTMSVTPPNTWGNKRNKFHGTWIKTKQNRTEQNRTEQGKAAKREECDELVRRPKIVTTCKANYYQGRRRIGTEFWALLPDGHVNVVMLHVSWLNAFHKITFNGFQLTKCIVGTKILVRGSSCFTEFTVKTLSLAQRVVKFYQSLPWSYLRVVLHVHISWLCLALGHTKFLTITQNNGICS